MNATIRYHVRVQAPSEPEDGYVVRSEIGSPVWTWSRPEPLELGAADLLRRDAIRLCGGTLYLQEAQP